MSTTVQDVGEASRPRTGTDADDARQARVDLAAVHRIAVLEGLHEGTWSHFSATVPGRPGHLLLTPGHTHFSRVTASSLLETDAEGGVVAGTGTPNISAWAIHAPIHEARPEMACALHVHSPYVTALSSIDGLELETRGGQLAALFHENLALFGYEGIVTEDDEGRRMAEALGDRRALLLANHGALVLGETIEIAMLHVLALERASMTQWHVMATGRPMRRVPEEAARRVAAMGPDGFGEAGYLDAMKAVLDHRGEDYAA